MCSVQVVYDLSRITKIAVVAKRTNYKSSLIIHQLKCPFHNQERQSRRTNKLSQSASAETFEIYRHGRCGNLWS